VLEGIIGMMTSFIPPIGFFFWFLFSNFYIERASKSEMMKDDSVGAEGNLFVRVIYCVWESLGRWQE
jgi:hypothetical protein